MKKFTCILFILIFSLGPAYSFSDQKYAASKGDIILLPDKTYYKTLVDYIRKANSSIDVAMFLFKTTNSKKNRPRQLVNELVKARKRGVAVRVVLEKSGYEDSINKENEKVARRLRKNNIQVLFDTAKTTTHVKMVVIDKKYSFVGSHNLTHAALYYNHEMSLLIDSPQLANDFIRYIETIAH